MKCDIHKHVVAWMCSLMGNCVMPAESRFLGRDTVFFLD